MDLINIEHVGPCSDKLRDELRVKKVFHIAKKILIMLVKIVISEKTQQFVHGE